MKKVLMVLLALVLMMSGSVAVAETNTSPYTGAEGDNTITIPIAYDMTDVFNVSVEWEDTLDATYIWNTSSVSWELSTTQGANTSVVTFNITNRSSQAVTPKFAVKVEKPDYIASAAFDAETNEKPITPSSSATEIELSVTYLDSFNYDAKPVDTDEELTVTLNLSISGELD